MSTAAANTTAIRADTMLSRTGQWTDILEHPIRRILIIKPSAVGDVARTLPVLTALRKKWPGAHIAWLIASHCADLLIDHPALDERIIFDRHEYGRMLRRPRAAGDFLRFLATLRAKRFDLVIDLQGLFRSAFLSAATAARFRVGRRDAREFASVFYSHRAKVDGSRMHALLVNAGVVAPLAVTVRPTPADLYISPRHRESALRLLQASGISPKDGFALLCPGSNWPTKDWPAEKFGALATMIHRRLGLRCVVIGTKAQQHLGRRITEIEPAVIDLCGRSTLAEAVAIIDAARIVISNDSGPLHVAALLNKPLVGIYGPTDPNLVGPFGHLEWVVTSDCSCLRCGIKRIDKCPYGHRCMQTLDPSTVFEMVSRRLTGP